MRLFQNRREAATELARLLAYLKSDDPVVLGLANGGVPVAEVIAESLQAPLDVLLIERLAAPQNPEHIVGAVDEHGRISMIKSTARWHHLTSREMIDPARDAFKILTRKRGRIRAVLPEMDVRDRTVIVVSHGVATGAKMLGAVASVKDRGARKVVAAAPAGSGEAAWALQDSAHQVVIPHRPTKFVDVAHLYREYTPVTDDIVQAIIERWVRSRPPQQPGVSTIVMKVQNDLGHLLCCEIDLPPGTTRGAGPFPTVVFAHGFESDGRNVRTVPISRRLAKRGIIGIRPNFTGHGQSEGEAAMATPEQMARDLDIILANVRRLNEVDEDRFGLVGSGSGASLALRLSSRDASIRTVVVRGPMIGGELEATNGVDAPTMIIHAGEDRVFADEHRRHGSTLKSMHAVLEVPDANRLFTDAISLELMVGATVDWIVDHLVQPPVHEDPPVAESSSTASITPEPN